MNLEQIKATIAELQLIVDEQETLFTCENGTRLKDQDPCWTVRFSPNSNTWEPPLCKKMSAPLLQSITEQKLGCYSSEEDAIIFYKSQPRINEYVSASINVRIYENGTVKFTDGVNYFSKDELDRIFELRDKVIFQ